MNFNNKIMRDLFLLINKWLVLILMTVKKVDMKIANYFQNLNFANGNL